MSRTEIGSLSTVFEKNKRKNDEEIRRIEREKQAKRKLQKSREKQNDHQKSYHDTIKAAKNAEIVKNLQAKKSSAEITIPDKYRVKKPVKDKNDASQNIKSNGFNIDTKRQAVSREEMVKMRKKMQSPDNSKIKKSEKRPEKRELKKSEDEDVPKKKKKKKEHKSDLRSKMDVSSDDYESIRIKKKEKKHKKDKSERSERDRSDRPDKHREKHREKSEKQEKRDRHEKHRQERSERSDKPPKPSKHILPPSKKATGTNKAVDFNSLFKTAQQNSQIDPEDLLRERRREKEAKVRDNFDENEALRKRLKAKELAETMNNPKKSLDKKREDKRKADDAALVHEKRRKLLAKMEAEEESGGKSHKTQKGQKSSQKSVLSNPYAKQEITNKKPLNPYAQSEKIKISKSEPGFSMEALEKYKIKSGKLVPDQSDKDREIAELTEKLAQKQKDQEIARLKAQLNSYQNDDQNNNQKSKKSKKSSKSSTNATSSRDSYSTPTTSYRDTYGSSKTQKSQQPKPQSFQRPSLHGSSGPGSYHMNPRMPDRFSDDEDYYDESENDSSLDDFIASDDEEATRKASKMMKKVTGYDPKKFRHIDVSDRALSGMHTKQWDLDKEERKSLREGKREDAEELAKEKEEEAEEARKLKAKKDKKKKKGMKSSFLE